MIYYFSGTGNSKWVAEELGKKLNLETMDIIDLKDQNPIQMNDEEPIGFVFPIYAWAPPKVMMDFIKGIKNHKNNFKFIVCTCGEEVGTALKKAVKEYAIHSCYSIIMPNNYILGIDIDTEEVTIKKIKKAKKQIEHISQEICTKKSVYEVEQGSFGAIKSNLVAPLFQKYATSTKPFYVEDTCIGCSICEKVCPLNTIKLVDGKPVWNKECLQCLSCINRCPKEAIQYGKKTKGRGRYYFKESYKNL
nr:EFR1 family ferrodoxin [uncultured Niameybacter sp.]